MTRLFGLLLAVVTPLLAAEPVVFSEEGPVATLALRPPAAAPTGTPRLDDDPLPVTAARIVVPLAAGLSSTVVRERVLREQRSAAAWAALSEANYREGRYEAAWAAARQMRVAAVALDIPLSIRASDLYEKCRRAAEALALTE